MHRRKAQSLLLALYVAGCLTVSACGSNQDADIVSESSAEETVITVAATETTMAPLGSYMIENSLDASNAITAYASDNGISRDLYPQSIVDFFVEFPDAYNFVMNYPTKIAMYNSDDFVYEYPDISSEISKVVVPKLYQWDERWGYRDYCGQPLGFNGSGPACVSMASIYFTGNTDFTPAWIMDYAINNNYCDTEGSGTYRTLITSGARGLGIDVVEITVDQDRIKRNLDVGNLVVCAMGSGVFSNPYESEHFIIITGYTDEGFTIIDPGSVGRTDQIWPWEGLSLSMNVPWVYRIM